MKKNGKSETGQLPMVSHLMKANLFCWVLTKDNNTDLVWKRKFDWMSNMQRQHISGGVKKNKKKKKKKSMLVRSRQFHPNTASWLQRFCHLSVSMALNVWGKMIGRWKVYVKDDPTFFFCHSILFNLENTSSCSSTLWNERKEKKQVHCSASDKNCCALFTASVNITRDSVLSLLETVFCVYPWLVFE